MSTMKFKCTLLTDVILNQKSATEGNRQTLDFIPGNNFLGIVASKLYGEEIDGRKALVLFHTGDVKFGDAHPSKGKVRGLKIPAVMFYPKLKQMTEECYVHHLVPDLSCKDIKDKQLKQCRSGFYCFSPFEKKAEKVGLERSFAIKSAYDKQNRRSKDEMMYGYESLEKGSIFYFEVCFNDRSEKYKEEIKSCLEGERRIGRSRTAQYGLVKIKEADYEQVSSDFQKKENIVTVYADGRLIFLDEFGIPTFRPTEADLGFSGGKIRWDKSQIRTFQYAPWNSKRQTYDTDRCGIEKGSVFVIELSETDSLSPVEYIGSYQNEGFGKVIYNPDFLSADKKGKTMYRFTESARNNEPAKVNKSDDLKANVSLLKYLRNQKNIEMLQNDIYKEVNEFVDDYSSLYKGGDSFAAQWRTIRKIAMKYKGEELKVEIETYLGHGVAFDKWNRRMRKEKFMGFINACAKEKLQDAVINLAAEMAKVCK